MTATSSPEPRPARVGRYRLLARIGEGGMGVVHLAQSDGGDRVALKVLRPHVIGDDEARERLAREVASLRRVTSPRVAEVIDADPWGETPFVATRYVPGLSLHQHVRALGPVTGEDLAWFAAGLVEAVVAVHRVGVLHRDIKPSNVLLEGRSPVLIDFGLARLAEDPRLTHAGWLLGTPGYLAPEVLYGEDATPASDVHAWAATVVFAALGRPPFGTGPAFAIMDRVRRGEHDLTGLPPDLAPLLRHALAADPADRPSTGAVVAALRDAVPDPSAGRTADTHDHPTMPYVLAQSPGPDDEPTRVTTPGADDTRADDTRADDTRADHTRVDGTRAGGSPAPAVPAPHPMRAVREPYEQPPPPSDGDHSVRRDARPALVAGGPRGRPSRTARLQRSLLLGGLLLSVAGGSAAAPYLTVMVLGLSVLVLRAVSWTTDAARERQHLRGRRRWWDAPLTLSTSPWYLVVAAGGTVLLLAWAGIVTGLAGGLAVLLLQPPLPAALAALGLLLGLLVWWGPGARRLRVPAHRLLGMAVRDPWVGWTVVAGLSLAVAGLVWTVLAGEVSWAPAQGAPWRAGTLLGDLRGWLAGMVTL